MQLTVSHLSALRALRVARREKNRAFLTRQTMPLPDSAPRARWTPGSIPLEPLGLDEPPSRERPLSVVVPSRESRLQASFFSCSVHLGLAEERSFVELGEGLFIPCPELLFLELAEVMEPEPLALVGYELCGSFSRDPASPRFGQVTYDLPPVTTVEKIARYLQSHGRVPGCHLAREVIGCVRDNAWSVPESVVALMVRMPAALLGYGMGDILLNAREPNASELVALGCRESRVPDMEFVGTCLGFNYDGGGHLDLESIARAAETGESWRAVRAVREKYVDDLRRNRELAASGHIVLPITREDLFAPRGLDAAILEGARVLERFDGADVREVRAAISSERLSMMRQRLVWSLLPWHEGVALARSITGASEGRGQTIAEYTVAF